jgi:hypothetical protein
VAALRRRGRPAARLDEIGARTGSGDLLAEGSRRASAEVGR